MTSRQAQQHAEGAVCDLRAQLPAFLLGFERGVEQLLPQVRGRQRLEHEEGDRDPELRRKLAHPRQLGQRIVRILSVDARFGDLVDDGSAREAERARFDGLGGELRHGGDVLGRGRLVRDAARAHHVGPQRDVADVGCDVHCEATAVEGVQVFGEGLPLPRKPGAEYVAGNVLD